MLQRRALLQPAATFSRREKACCGGYFKERTTLCHFVENLAGLGGEFGVGEEGVEGLPRESGFVQGALGLGEVEEGPRADDAGVEGYRGVVSLGLAEMDEAGEEGGGGAELLGLEEGAGEGPEEGGAVGEPAEGEGGGLFAGEGNLSLQGLIEDMFKENLDVGCWRGGVVHRGGHLGGGLGEDGGGEGVFQEGEGEGVFDLVMELAWAVFEFPAKEAAGPLELGGVEGGGVGVVADENFGGDDTAAFGRKSRGEFGGEAGLSAADVLEVGAVTEEAEVEGFGELIEVGSAWDVLDSGEVAEGSRVGFEVAADERMGGWEEFFVGVEPKDPRGLDVGQGEVSAGREVVVPGEGDDARAEILGELGGAVSGTGFRDDDFHVEIDDGAEGALDLVLVVAGEETDG